MLIKIFERGIYMITELELPQDRFNVVKLKDIKKKTFIYGKNGTGKSSIVECIQKQYSNEYDIKVFQGYERIIADYGKLGLISLGVENVEIQKQIKEKEAEIKLLEADLDDTPEDRETLQKRYNKQEVILNKEEKIMLDFYRKSASELKNSKPSVFKSNYNKKDFEEDVKQLKVYTERELDEAKKNFEQRTIKIDPITNYSLEELSQLGQKINQLLVKEVIESVELTFNTQQERTWVQEGVYLHENTECCLYCGGKITADRKLALNNYFNENLKRLHTEILSCEAQIKEQKTYVQGLPLIKKEQFLLKYEDDVIHLNEKIIFIKEDAILFLEKLQEKLQYKKDNLFLVIDTVAEYDQENIKSFIEAYKNLYNVNFYDNKNLSVLQEYAKKVIRNALVYTKSNEFGYKEKYENLISLRNLWNDIKEEVRIVKNNLKKIKDELKQLQLQTVDEGKAAEYINKAIQGLGNQSFTLEKSEESHEKGVYKVRDHSGEIRSTETLSTGEKNIVAFLWFIQNLENLNHLSTKKKVIIFDDPMNSNDDTTQYLIISELQNLIQKEKNQIFILTHNAHFYINTRYQWWRKDKQNKVTFRLIKKGNASDVILIKNEDSDIKTSYDGLWQEVKWLYEQDKPDFMLNPIRRILETYRKFNCIDDLFDGYNEAEKLFNVNSHSIDDLECDPNGKSRDEIIELVRMVFENKGAENHFKAHWDENID